MRKRKKQWTARVDDPCADRAYTYVVKARTEYEAQLAAASAAYREDRRLAQSRDQQTTPAGKRYWIRMTAAHTTVEELKK